MTQTKSPSSSNSASPSAPTSAPTSALLTKGVSWLKSLVGPLSSLTEGATNMAQSVKQMGVESDQEIEREHQELVIGMLTDYLHKQLGAVEGARHARLLSEALLGFRSAPVEPELAALLEVSREAILQIDLFYTRQGSRFEVCMRLFVSDVTPEGKRVLKQVRLKRPVDYDEVPQVVRFGVVEAEANGAPLSVTLLRPETR